MAILGATLLSDRKSYSMLLGVKALVESAAVDEVYINIQTSNKSLYQPLFNYLAKQCTKPYWIDVWNYDYERSFRTQPAYDQDTARLAPIVTARNMALEVAMRPHFSHVLFVDSDVIPFDLTTAVKRMLACAKPIIGGVVPGRGAHKHAHYIFGLRHDKHLSDTVICCDHGTCGYVLIDRYIYDVIRFRYGPHPTVRGQFLSEDPAYLADAEHMKLADGWYIDLNSTAAHIDNADAPLTMSNSVNGYTSLTDKA